MVGYFTRMLDDRSLVRGVTYTIMPDGESIRVPVMNRRDVRAAAQMHTGDEDHDAMQALKDILGGRKPRMGRAHFDKRGRAVGGRTGHRSRHMPGGRGIERPDMRFEGMHDYVRPISILETGLGGDPAYVQELPGGGRNVYGGQRAPQHGTVINRPGVEMPLSGDAGEGII